MSIEYFTFPKVPEDIKQSVLEQARKISFQENQYNLTADENLLSAIKKFTPKEDDSMLGVMFEDAQGYFKDKIANFAFIEADPVLVKWVKNNISMSYRRVDVQVMTGGVIVVPHIDEIRQGALNYILSSGGTDVTTTFYEPLNKDLVAVPQQAFPYDRISIKDSTVILEEQWHILDVTKIHGVENLSPNEYRISISISL